MEWNNFKKAVKKARENSGVLFGFDTGQYVRIYNVCLCCDLNPFKVNLKSGYYGCVVNIQTGKIVLITDLKKIVRQM